jgi:hypothetical protein
LRDPTPCAPMLGLARARPNLRATSSLRRSLAGRRRPEPADMRPRMNLGVAPVPLRRLCSNKPRTEQDPGATALACPSSDRAGAAARRLRRQSGRAAGLSEIVALPLAHPDRRLTSTPPHGEERGRASRTMGNKQKARRLPAAHPSRRLSSQGRRQARQDEVGGCGDSGPTAFCALTARASVALSANRRSSSGCRRRQSPACGPCGGLADRCVRISGCRAPSTDRRRRSAPGRRACR